MKIVIQFILCFISTAYIHAQIPTEYGSPIKWDKYDYRSNFLMKGLDTLSKDSILITREKYIRQNQQGLIIEELIYAPLNALSCDDDGLKLTGHWTKYYKTGEISEHGKLVCNRKLGGWLYFYKSGQLMRYEKYDVLDIIDTNPNVGYLNGTYLEYHPNGRIKTSGVYKIVEEYAPFLVVNFQTYEIQEECCQWVPKSIKYGEWIEYDSFGNISNSILFTPSIKDSTNLREIGDGYLKLDINKLRE